MLMDAIRSLLGSRQAPQDSVAETGAAFDPVHLAACALLLDLAYADGEFSEPERRHLEDVFARHFLLAPDAVAQLLELADRERRNSVDYFKFTSQLRNYDTGQKMVLAEIMWGLVMADGSVSDHEQYLTRKISHLLDLQPGYLSAARVAAENRRSG